MEIKSDVPNPGSNEAIEMGCTCPVIDNGRGRGSMYGENIFIYTAGCPVHCPEDEDNDDD